MALANYFYHASTKKYIAAFGSLFDQITIERVDEASQQTKKLIVPIAYGPWQKFLVKKVQDPKLDRAVSMSLPRMSFEIIGMSYDAQRKIPSTKKIKIGDGRSMHSPVPYTIDISLYIMGKYVEDVYKIQEQIIPFFGPEYTPSIEIIEGMEPLDTPIVLSSVAMEDSYEGDFETRRAIIATLNFQMSVEFYHPVRERKVIKFMDIDMYDKMETNVSPATNVSSWLIDLDDEDKIYQNVEETDNWGVESNILPPGEYFVNTNGVDPNAAKEILVLNIEDEEYISKGKF